MYYCSFTRTITQVNKIRQCMQCSIDNRQQNAIAFDLSVIIYLTHRVGQNCFRNINMSFISDKNAKKVKPFQNCLVCLLRPSFYFGYSGITAIKFRCNHSLRPVTVSLERSILTTCIAITVLIINVIFGCLNILTLLDY